MKRFILSLLTMMVLSSLNSLYSIERKTGKWWDSAVFYQIFPLSYYDTDADGRGDIKGITAKLDYISDLGVTALWLTPFHPRPQGFYHGYAVSDYYGVEPELGTMKDYEELIQAAHKKGIKVILDLVMNHTSDSHPWFLDSANMKSHNDYYLWKKSSPSGWANATGNSKMPAWNELATENTKRKGEYFYAAFNFTLPDLNHTNPEVKAEFRKLAKFWLDKGVDGFRIDAARYLIETGPGAGQIDTQETIDYLDDFARYVKSINPDAYVVGEVYAGMDIIAKYYKKGGMDACFNFDFGGKGGTIQGTMQTGKTRSFMKNLDKILSQDKGGLPFTYYANYFSNHDSGRMPENLRYPDKVQAAALLLFTIPGGAPYIYYGDEIGEREGYELIGDANMRNPMYWDNTKNAGFTDKSGVWLRKMKKYYMDPKEAESKAEQKEAQNMNVKAELADPQSTLNFFKQIIALRKASPALQYGDFKEIKIDMDKIKIPEEKSDKPKNPLVTFSRTFGDEVVIVLLNTGKKKVILNQALGLDKLANLNVAASIDSKDLTAGVDKKTLKNLQSNKLNLSLESREFMVIQFKK